MTPDPAQEDTPANDIVDGLCRRMLIHSFMGAGGKTDHVRVSDIKRSLALIFTDEEIERASKALGIS